jgi:hypothetical protein
VLIESGEVLKKGVEFSMRFIEASGVPKKGSWCPQWGLLKPQKSYKWCGNENSDLTKTLFFLKIG